MKAGIIKMKTKTVKVSSRRLSVRAPVLQEEEMEYNKDFFKWTKTQANLLKKHDFSHLDIDNLREEIESLGRNDKRALQSQAVRLLMHLLKQKLQPEKQINSNSWNNSIIASSLEIKYLIKDSPSLKNELIKVFPEAYEDARHGAAAETGLDIKKFPEKCPWEIQKILPFLAENIPSKRKKTTLRNIKKRNRLNP